ncbi:MAG TPA: sigma-70 family RNA polymerase sigma factor, partial [Methylomirabilota bacterium]|nr:sigma-70 family RNA polymerase sigma factor [Methylomirabilota bacterium]
RVRKETVSLDEVSDSLEDLVNPADIVNSGLQQKKILPVLHQLTGEQQQVIKYKFFEDLSNDEIAFILNKTEGAIRVIQHRAIMRLKDLLKNSL